MIPAYIILPLDPTAVLWSNMNIIGNAEAVLDSYIEEPHNTCYSFIISNNKCTKLKYKSQYKIGDECQTTTCLGTRVPFSGGLPKQRDARTTRQFRY
jgi:hypothetical protein